LDTSEVPLHLKPYLPLLLEMILESPILDGEEEIPYEDVVAKLADDCLESSFSVGLGGSRFLPGSFAQSAILYLQTVPSKYEIAVQWIRKLLFQTKLTYERAKVLGTKMENSASELKRKGSKVVSIMMNSVLFEEKSNHQASNMVNQQRFLRTLLKKLECSPNEVLKDLEEVRFYLTKPSNMMVHMAADLGSLQNPSSPWSSFLPAHIPKKIIIPSKLPEHTLTISRPSHLLLGLGSCESAFLSRTTPSITDPKSKDLPALMLAIQYLTQLEGPMWRQIRGAGLAYGYFMYASPNKGQLYLTLYKATDPFKAFKEAKNIITSHIEDIDSWNDTLFESAKSSLIFELIEKEKSLGEVVQESLLSSLKGVDRKFNRNFLEMIDQVTKEDLAKIASVYLTPLFSGETRTTVVCSPGKVKSIKEDFKNLGVNFDELESIENILGDKEK